MFCDYGFNFSGSKYIAINKLDIEKRDIAFSTIVTLKGLIAIVISILWIAFVFYYPIFKNNIKDPHLISLKKALNNSDLVICGTSAFSDLEKKAIIQCKKNSNFF